MEHLPVTFSWPFFHYNFQLPPGLEQLACQSSKRLLTRFGRSHFNPANQGSGWCFQQHENDLRNILRRNLPIRDTLGTAANGTSTKFGIDASRHDTSNSHSFISVIQHHSFTKTVQSKLRSVVCRPARECIFSSQATYIDDVAAFPVPHP